MGKNSVKFYMQQYPTELGVAQPIKDLETDFNGLLVSAIGGINNKGKNKNIYKEKFVEQNGCNVWIGTPYYESTSISMKLYFVGTSRQDVFDSFCDYVNGCGIYYWDSYHNKKVTLVLDEPIEPSDEVKTGANPYIEVTIKFTNIDGTFTKVE